MVTPLEIVLIVCNTLTCAVTIAYRIIRIIYERRKLRMMVEGKQ